MSKFLIRKCVLFIIVSILTGCGGCGAFATDKHMDMVRAVAVDAVQRVEDGDMQFSANAVGHNPGVLVEAGMVYRAVARYDGIHGSVNVAGGGKLGTREMSPAILEVLNSSTLDEQAKREFIIRLLERQPGVDDSEPVNPVP